MATAKEKFVKNLKSDIRHTYVLEGGRDIDLTDPEYNKLYEYLMTYQTMTALAMQIGVAKYNKDKEAEDFAQEAWNNISKVESRLGDRLWKMGVFKSKYDTPWKTEGMFKDEEDCDGLLICAYNRHEAIMKDW